MAIEDEQQFIRNEYGQERNWALPYTMFQVIFWKTGNVSCFKIGHEWIMSLCIFSQNYSEKSAHKMTHENVKNAK